MVDYGSRLEEPTFIKTKRAHSILKVVVNFRGCGMHPINLTTI